MNSESPRVSIIMATFNRAHFIGETLDSILKQSFPKWECLIIDDGSTDSTLEILKPYLKKDNRLKYYPRTSNHRKGLPGCRNQGLELARGDYIIFFDDDDIVHPENLECCVEGLVNSSHDFFHYQRKTFKGNFHYRFDKKKNHDIIYLEGRETVEKLLTHEIPFNSCQVMWKKVCFTEDQFTESLMFAEEWELYSRILSDGYNGISIDKTLFYGRKHPNSNTGEFWNNDPIRKASKIKAVRMVADNLKKKGLWTPSLKKYFIRLAFSVKSFSLLNNILEKTGAGRLKSLKYKLGYIFYPILRPVFKIKGKI